jgi:hypothetical protein
MVAGQHKLSRRAVLAGACVLPVACHSGLDPEPMNEGGTPASTSVFMGPGLRRDDGADRRKRWQTALARYASAQAALEAVAHVEDDALYDRALGRHNGALARLLRTAAPNLAAAAAKLDLILRHSVFELTFGEPSLAALRRDLTRFA